MRGLLKKGEIWPEGGRLIDGLNWWSQEDGSPLVLAYFQKRIRGEGEKGRS